MRAKTRRYRQIALVAVAAAVLLGVNVPPAFSYVQEWRHERLINSPEYKAQYGHWDTIEVPPDNRVNSIHAVLLNNGKVLLIAGSGNKEDMFATRALKSLVYDPTTGQSRMIPVPDDMFCGGQTVLPDGRVLFAGGTQRYEKLDGAVTNAAGAMRVKNENPNGPRFLPAGTEFVAPSGQKYKSAFDVTLPPAAKTGAGKRTQVTASEEKVFVESEVPGPQAVNGNRDKYTVSGLSAADSKNIYGLGEPMTLDKQDYQGTNKAYTFDPKTEAWTELPDMNQPRWYPTLTPLSDGNVLTVAGLDGVGQVLNGLSEEFDPRTNTWIDRRAVLTQYFPTYPALFETEKPRQIVYTGSNAGYGPATEGRVPGFWDLDTGAFTPIPGLRQPELMETSGSSWIGPVQDQRLAVVGGGGVGESPISSSRIDFLDLKDPAPHFTPGPDLAQPTRYPNLVNLPDDTTLITNGSLDYRGKGATNNHLAYTLDPTTNQLTPMADPRIGRDYHTEALLLPDGRVLVAGSDPLFDDEKNTIPGTFEQRIEIFTPPYLESGAPRPTISSAPPVLTRGQTVTIPTPDASRIAKARLIRTSSATHVTTTDMRDVALDMQKTPDGVSITVPKEATIVPPGPYMLFLVDDKGVPSEAKILDVP
ncbi:galactose oxidase-like domain-containing protein [Actinomycetospora sp. CA-084318]|uniref:galactose oxidase early set domain-containing protein n=1 Tax=Actinomycetospora sp. CA-084318 TaxID=3239892 RepID=UPI003D95C888